MFYLNLGLEFRVYGEIRYVYTNTRVINNLDFKFSLSKIMFSSLSYISFDKHWLKLKQN